MSLLSKLKMSDENEVENLDENESIFAADPEPGERPNSRKNAAKKAAPVAPHRATRTTTKLAKEVAEDLTSLLQATAAVWGMQDECCAPVLAEQAEPIAKALTQILARNPRLLQKFANSDIASYTLQSVALGRALLPVGKAVYRNHVSRAVDSEEENGRPGAVNLSQFPAFSGPSRSVPA